MQLFIWSTREYLKMVKEIFVFMFTYVGMCVYTYVHLCAVCVLTVYHMQEDGWIKVCKQDVSELLHRYRKEKD